MSTQCARPTAGQPFRKSPVAGHFKPAPTAGHRLNPAPRGSARVRGGSPVARRRFH